MVHLQLGWIPLLATPHLQRWIPGTGLVRKDTVSLVANEVQGEVYLLIFGTDKSGKR